jgi:pSer/pThr/pTyr-binding forkhead associated (FHA) protein
MQLKVFSEQTNQSWTLKPQRDYVIGSGSECDLPLPYPNIVDSRHLRLSFDQSQGSWTIYDLGSSNGTYINNQRVNNYVVRTQTRIGVGGGVFIVLTPEVNTAPAPSIPSAPPAPPPPVYNQNRTAPVSNSEQVYRYTAPVTTSPLRVLSWGDYVEAQAAKLSNWWNRVALRFYLMTGLRNMLWVNFDGYIIPNFQEPADKIALGIENNLNQLKQYEDTDCHAVFLTDAHLTDSTAEVFSGIELFALKRGNKRDFRRFCVVSHHRIRSYVVVENYGADLFVGRLTRFESQPDGFVPGLILGLSIFIVLILTFFSTIFESMFNLYGYSVSVGLWLLILVGIFWTTNFILVPFLMKEFKLLPRPANTQLIWLLLIFGLWVFVFLLKLLFPR